MNMLFVSPNLIRALICLVALTPFGAAGAVQEQSREDALKEAGRLGTEAERIRGEAYKLVAAGGDRKLLREAELAAAERISQALHLWRAANHFERLFAGTEELSRIYSILNDYESTVNLLTREAEFWLAREDIVRQVHLILLMGIRQMQMRRTDAAIKTLEHAAELSRAANLISSEIGSLESVVMLLEKSERASEVEPLRARLRELRAAQFESASAVETKQQPAPLELPLQWLDLPGAPLAAEYRHIDGVRQAVLVNRSARGIEFVGFGCVRSKNGRVEVLSELVWMGLNHGGVAPGSYYEPFAMLNGPANRWTDERMGCEGKARIAVIKAVYSDRTEWTADGTNWKSR